jgi:transcriptional regulator with XRE-family HTH domain
MSDGMTGSTAEWIVLWRSEMTMQDLRHRELDDRAGLPEGYVSKIMCGLVKEPTAATISKINRALGIRFVRLAAERAAPTP